MALSRVNYKQLFWFETQFPSFMLKLTVFFKKICFCKGKGVGEDCTVLHPSPGSLFLSVPPQVAMPRASVGQER